MAFDNFAADRESDSGTGHILSVKAFENAKDALMVLRIHSDPIVIHSKLVKVVHPYRGNMNRWGIGAAVFDRIPKQVLKHL